MYILEGHTPVPARNRREGIRWYIENSNSRIVAQEIINGELVSTVFLGSDYRCIYSKHRGEPQFFETMVFCRDGKTKLFERCTTWEQAEYLHSLIAAKLKTAVFHLIEGGKQTG